MNPQNLAKIDLVTGAFADWKGAQDRFAELEKQFNAAVALYSKGQGEFPDHLYGEMRDLRRQADQSFQRAAHALRTAAGGRPPKNPEDLDGSSVFGDLLQ